MIFYVIELQSSTTGAVISFAFTNQPDAEAKYHELLSVAAKSAVPKHGAMLISGDGFVIKEEFYDHTVPAAEE